MKVFAITVQQRTDLLNKILTILEGGPKSVEELEQEIPETSEWHPAGQVRLRAIDLVKAGYIYSVPGGYLTLTRYGKEKIGVITAKDLTVGNPELGTSATDTYRAHTGENMATFANSFSPYWEYFKNNHPEYIKVYEKFEGDASAMKGLIADVYEILQHNLGTGDAVTLFENETVYEVPKNLVSVEHAIFEEMMRVLKNDKKFQLIKSIEPENYVATVRYLKDFFIKNGASLVQNVLISTAGRKPGVVLTEADVDVIIGEVGARGIDKSHLRNSIYGWLVKQTNEGDYGVFLTGTSESSIVRSLRELFKEEPNKGNVIFKNFKTTSPNANTLNKVLTGGVFEGVNFKKADFSGLTITNNAKFIGCYFEDAVFTGATIVGCDFTGSFLNRATMNVIRFSDNLIQDVDFAGVTNLGDTNVDFSNNRGKAKNFKFEKEVLDNDTYKAVSNEMNRSFHHSFPLTGEELEVAKVLAKGLGRFLEDTGGSKTSSLVFSAVENLEELRQQLTAVIQSQGGERPADWMQSPETARVKLVELNRSGVLKELGFDQMMGKLMGWLASKPREEKKIVDPLGEAKERINSLFDVSSGANYISKPDLLAAIPPHMSNLYGMIENASTGDRLSGKNLSSIYAALIQQFHSGETPLLSQQSLAIASFPHTIRVSDLNRDRETSTKYPSVFGIVLEPYTYNIPNSIKPFMDPFQGGDKNWSPPSGWDNHWYKALATSRIRPIKLQEYGGDAQKSSNVWLTVEIQSDVLQNSDAAWSALSKGESGDIPIPSGKDELNQIFTVLYRLSPMGDGVSWNKFVQSYLQIYPYPKGVREIRDPNDKLAETINSLKLVIRGNSLIKSDRSNIWMEDAKTGRSMKAFQDLKNFYRSWPEVTLLAIIRKALEHGNVDEVWVPTAENFMKYSEDQQGHEADRRDQYDVPAQRLGGNRVSTPTAITPDRGSALWSRTGSDPKYKPQTWYRIDLTPYKLLLKPGDTVVSKDSSSEATIVDINKFSKYDNPNKYTLAIPREQIVSVYKDPFTEEQKESRTMFVIVYTVSGGKEILVTTPKDFAEKYATEKRFSNLSLRFTSMNNNLLTFGSAPFGDNSIRKSAASPQAESVLKFVKGVIGANPFLEQFPQPLLLSSGVAKRAKDEQWPEEDVNRVVDELQQLGHVVYRPIRRYVAAIIHIMKKKLMGGELQRLVQNMGEPVERVGKEMIISYFQRQHGDWGEEEVQYVASEIDRVAAGVVYPQIKPRDPFAPDTPRRAPQEGRHDPVTGDPITPVPSEGGNPEAPDQKQSEGPIPGLTFVKPTGEELEGYNKEYETRLYDRLKKSLDDGDYDKAKRLHKMLSVLVSGETSKKRESYTNILLDYLNEANVANNEDKARTIKDMLFTLHITSSMSTIIGDLKFSR